MTTQALNEHRLVPIVAGLVAVTACGAAAAVDGLPILAAAVVIVAAAVMSYRHPSGMLLAVISVAVLVPVDLAPQMEPLPRLGPTRALLFAFLAGWTARALVDRQVRRPPALPLARGWVLYLAATVLGTVVSIEPIRSLFFLASLLIEQLLLFYIAVYQSREPGFERALLSTLAVLTVAVSAGAAYEAVTHSNPIFLLYPWETTEYRLGLLRVRSTFFHPIALGTFLTLVLPFLVVDAAIARGLRRVAVGAAATLALGTSFLTFSRGPWLAQALALAILAAWWVRGRLIRLAAITTLVALLAGLGLVLAATVPAVSDSLRLALDPNRLTEGGLFESSSEYYRIALFEAVFARLNGVEWLYGLGPGTFYLADVESTYAGHQHVLTAADSQLAKLLLEQGLVGTASFLVLIAGAVGACARAARRAPAKRAAVRVAALGAVTGFLVSNLTVSMFFLLPLALLFWVAVALGVAPGGRASEP
jgi:O-antigen ligase